MACLEEEYQWVCIHTSSSLFEANLLRSFLENQGIKVNVCAPSSQYHEYIHDKGTRIRIFIPKEDIERGKYFTRRLTCAERPNCLIES